MDIPIDVRHLFKSLDEQLITLLENLSKEEWAKQTVASRWKVKDVASHLLDGNIRALSIQRDRYFGEESAGFHDYQELVNWLNALNADWIKASRRISPEVLIYLHKVTGPLVSDYFALLDPWDQAVFPVDWAGEKSSLNWMHLAREYSEKWHHQQQIRDATGRKGIMTREFFHPAIATFILGLPHTFRQVDSPPGTIVKVRIPGEAGGDWYLIRDQHRWTLAENPGNQLSVSVSIPAELSWKLFTKSLKPNQVIDRITIKGDRRLGEKVLEMVSVMA